MAEHNVIMNPMPMGPPPVNIPPSHGHRLTSLVIEIDINADKAIKKLKSIQREIRNAIRALRELHSLADGIKDDAAAKEDN